MKFGILGLGSIGSRHAKNLLEMGHEVCGYDPNASKEFLATHPKGIEYVAYPESVLNHADALLVCTPTSLHTDGILLRDDVPIFVEKPIFDLSSRPALSVLEGRRIVVGYNLRFHPLVSTAREWLKDLGPPIWASFVVGQPNTKQYPDHVCLNWSHEIDLAEHLLGPLELALSRESHNMVQLAFSTQGNVAPVFVHLDYHSQPWIRQFKIQGENKQRIEVDLEEGHAGLLDSGSNPNVSDSETRYREDAFDESYRAEMQQFERYVQSGETGHLATAEDAIKIVDWFSEIVERRDK